GHPKAVAGLWIHSTLGKPARNNTARCSATEDYHVVIIMTVTSLNGCRGPCIRQLYKIALIPVRKVLLCLGPELFFFLPSRRPLVASYVPPRHDLSAVRIRDLMGVARLKNWFALRVALGFVLGKILVVHREDSSPGATVKSLQVPSLLLIG